MDEQYTVFLHATKPLIARTLYNLCHHPSEECYASNILRNLPDRQIDASAVHKTINLFEDHGWIEREECMGRTKPITLIEDGEQVFSKLIAFIDSLEA